MSEIAPPPPCLLKSTTDKLKLSCIIGTVSCFGSYLWLAVVLFFFSSCMKFRPPYIYIFAFVCFFPLILCFFAFLFFCFFCGGGGGGGDRPRRWRRCAVRGRPGRFLAVRCRTSRTRRPCYWNVWGEWLVCFGFYHATLEMFAVYLGEGRWRGFFCAISAVDRSRQLFMLLFYTSKNSIRPTGQAVPS